jgi:hypothetical protein
MGRGRDAVPWSNTAMETFLMILVFILIVGVGFAFGQWLTANIYVDVGSTSTTVGY